MLRVAQVELGSKEPEMPELLAVIYTAYLFASIYLAAAYVSKEIVKPPSAVRFAGKMEAAFGATLYLLAIYVPTTEYSVAYKILFFFLLNAFGIMWFIVGVQIMKSSRKARRISVILSILRTFTVIGTLPSFASIYLLYFRNSSKQFFQNSLSVADEFGSASIGTIPDESILGQKAVCLTDLKPIGKIIIDGQVFQGISRASFIEKGTEVQILEKKNHEYVVRPC